MAPASFHHGVIAARIAHRISEHALTRALGSVVTAEAGFILSRDPDTVRVPDVAFVGRSRIGPGNTHGFFDGPPDLVVEVVSPNDRLSEVTAKVEEWLAAGATSVWVADPPNQRITIHRASRQPFVYRVADELRDEPTLPGFVLPLSAVFGGS